MNVDVKNIAYNILSVFYVDLGVYTYGNFETKVTLDTDKYIMIPIDEITLIEVGGYYEESLKTLFSKS